MSEFKVGDKVMLEGVILPIAPYDNGFAVRMRGDDTAWNAITREAMVCATRIEPAPEPVENKVLDLSKPVRLISGSEELEFIQLATNGMIIIRWPSGSLDVLTTNEVENIPEPKRTMNREIFMIAGYDALMFGTLASSVTAKILARGTITLTEGDGMEDAK